MPASNESSFMQRIENIKRKVDSDQGNEFIEGLQEKGVECAILIPLFETILGFDAVEDIKYEYTSKEKFDRFDFLIDDKFIIEAKKINTKLSNIYGQIQKYIYGHSKINYGILSNGLEYAFFIQKDFIKSLLGPDEKLQIELASNVFHIFTLSVRDEVFLDIIKLFSKDEYHQNFIALAKFALTRINQTKATKISDDKRINLWLQDHISETMDIKPGVYIKDIQENKLKVGDKLVFENDCVMIPVILEKDGRVKLIKGTAEVRNMKLTMNGKFKNMIDLVMNDWKKEDLTVNDPLELIKVAIGQERLMRKEDYIFKKV